MGNKRTRRSKRFETPSPHREAEVTQPETLNSGNGTLIKFDNVVQESLGANPSGSQLTEPSTSNNEIQAWSQIIEQRTNDRIEKMREEMENKLDTILKRDKIKQEHLNSNKSKIRKHRELRSTTNGIQVI